MGRFGRNIVSERLACPQSVKQSCRGRIVVAPRTFEELETWVRDHWIRLCVVDTEIRMRGVPLRRQDDLVTGNPSLWRVWLATRRQTGERIHVRADYVWDGCQVGRIDFSVDRTVRVTPGEPSVQYLPSESEVESWIEQDRPPPPSIEDPTPGVWNLRPGPPEPTTFIRGLKIILEGYHAGLELGREVPLYGGRAYGFADTLARMATELPPDVESMSGYRPREPRPVTPRDVVLRSGGNRTWLQGYSEGFATAVDHLRERYETTSIPNQTFPSVAYLRLLATRYGASRRAIREGLIREHMRVSANWRQYVE